MIPRIMKYAMMALFGLFLTGCITAKVPFITDSNADKPFKRASIEIRNDEGLLTFDMELRTSWYKMINLSAKEKPESPGKLYLHKVQDNVFILQKQPGVKLTEVTIFIVRINGNELRIDGCDAYKDETLDKLGLGKGLLSCQDPSLEQLVALAKIPPDGNAKPLASGKIQILEK